MRCLVCFAKHHPCLALGGQAIEPARGVLRRGDPTVFNDAQMGEEVGQAEALVKMGFFAKPEWELQAREEWASVPPLVQEFWWPLSEWQLYEVVGWEVDMLARERVESTEGSEEGQVREDGVEITEVEEREVSARAPVEEDAWHASIRRHARRKLERTQEKGKGKASRVEPEVMAEEDEFEASLQAAILASRALAAHVLETPGVGPSTSSSARDRGRKRKDTSEFEDL